VSELQLEKKKSSSGSVEPPKSAEQPTMAAITQTYSGPIPPPNFLMQYEQIVPGIAKRFLEEPHLEAEHRRSLEKPLLNNKLNWPREVK